MSTKIERQLYRILDEMGLSFIEEQEFPPYRVDAYCPELHVAFEADGPHHTRARDKRRDALLMKQYGLHVHRIRQHSFSTATARAFIRVDIQKEIDGWSETMAVRKESTDDEG